MLFWVFVAFLGLGVWFNIQEFKIAALVMYLLGVLYARAMVGTLE